MRTLCFLKSQKLPNEKFPRGMKVEMNSTVALVVAAAIRDGAGRLLLQQRPEGKHHAGMWEFPGGKVEAHEKPRLSLVREVEEELAIVLDPAALEPTGFAEEPPSASHPAIVMLLYIADHRAGAWQGEVQPLEGQAWGWFTREEATGLDLPPMDRALLAGLTKEP
jgi:8-oxo-dGTP diphosphatase